MHDFTPPCIISASRRTDIPRYYGAWFKSRRSAGYAEARNAFGGLYRVSLRPEHVLGYLFWTRLARPFRPALRALSDEGVPWVVHYTVTGYDKDIDPGAPPLRHAVADFRETSSMLPDPGCIHLRYDPIVVSRRYDTAHHLRRFAEIAAALSGATRVVHTSVVEPYQRAFRRLADPDVRMRAVDPERHRWAGRAGIAVPQVGPEVGDLLARMACVAGEHGMELRTCSNPEWDLPRSQCCGEEIFAPYGDTLARRLRAQPAAPSRASCRCLRTCDIGMDSTCIAGCLYCYAVAGRESALASYRRHDPTAPRLR